jgi:hypothetical protein
MELHEFVTETLAQIVTGVSDAQERCKGTGARINPASRHTGTGYRLMAGSGGASLDEVEFDIALTKTEGTAAKGGIGVLLGSVGIGGQAKSERSDRLANRIKFKVPLMLPLFRPEES